MGSRTVLLVVSGNCYSSTDWAHHTANLWREMATEFDEFHIFARNADQRFATVSRGNVYLHLIPRGPARMLTFFVSSWWLPVVMFQVRPTHMQAQSPMHGGLAAVILGALFRVPVLLELHGEHYLRSGQVGRRTHRWFIRPTTRIAFKGATKIRSLSAEMSHEILATYGRSAAEKVVEIGNRVDLDVFSPPKLDYAVGPVLNIVSVGALNNNKNQSSLIRDLVEAGVRCRLTLVGQGGLRDQLIAEAGALGLPLEIVGGLNHLELREVLNQQDIYVHYSLSEAVSRAVLEAMAMGLPLIVSPGGFLGGIIDSGANGIRLESTGPAEIAEAISTLSVESVRARLGAAARLQIERHHEWRSVFAEHRAALLSMER